MTKEELKNRILRDLGHPMIKIELQDDHLEDSINDSVYEFKKFATGNATQEVYFTQLLSSGEYLYPLPTGVVSVVDYETDTQTTGINTLFTMENYMWNQGFLDAFRYSSSSTGMVSYHLALDFLNTLDRYTTSKYRYHYIPYRNELQITPTPSGDDIEIIRDDGTSFYSPGFVLLRAYMLTGASIGVENWSEEEWYNFAYDESWVRKFAGTLAKEKLGYIRRKFENFTSIGNTGISLDGNDLISEAKEEKEALMEELKDEYAEEGWGIILGS